MLVTATSGAMVVGGTNSGRILGLDLPEFKVLRSVVCAIAVLVMHPLMRFQIAA